MKTILVLTDFSAPSYTAAQFGLSIAYVLEANIKLCYVIEEIVGSRLPILPNEYIRLREDAIKNLILQVDDLIQDEVDSVTFLPSISYCTALGSITDTVSNIANEKNILLVMGMSGAGRIDRMIFGSNTLNSIDKANCPVLLVPFKNLPDNINKIAFASDLSLGDIDLIHSLVSFAKLFNAEILIVHISEASADQFEVDNFLNEVTNKVNYSKIYYRHIKDKSVDQGLDWIAKKGLIDVFAIVHRNTKFPENLFTWSVTKKLSRSIEIPLLVFQENQYPIF